MSRPAAVLFFLVVSFVVIAGVLLNILPLLLLALMGGGMALICWRAPLFVGTAALACAPLIGWAFSFSAERLTYGNRLFGGSIDVPLSDVTATVGLMALIAWLIRTQSWTDTWQRLPFLRSYGALVAAHLASLFSGAQPGMLGVIKYTLRPVVFSYAAFVALPVLLLRRWEDVRRAFGLFVVGASFFALQGFYSLFVNAGWSILSLQRARPLPLFGVYPIGVNHNVLAEWLVVAAPFALALAAWTHERTTRVWWGRAAVLCTMVALLTFARSAWITIIIELMAALCTIWRPYLGRIWRWMQRLGWIFIAPLATYMLWFSLRKEVATSTDARGTLTGIAWDAFTHHPLFGIGAGTFPVQVGNTRVFRLLFGAPLDAHGIFQKLLAETGIVGLGAFLLVTIVIARLAWRTIRRVGWQHRMGEGLLFAGIGVLGAWTYQIFNTTYWSAKLWLPIGLFFAASALYRRSKYV